MNRRFIFAAILLTIFLDFFNLGLIYPIFSSIVFEGASGLLALDASEFHKNVIFGTLIAAFPFGQFLGAPVIGQLSDEHGRRKLLLFSLMGTIATLLVSAVGVHWSLLPVLLLGRLAGGLMAGNMTIAYASLADFSSEKDKVKNFALIPLVIGAGFSLGPGLAGILAEISPAFPFIVAAVFSSINLALVAWKFPHTAPVQKEKETRFYAGLANISKAFRQNALRPYFWVLFFMIASNMVFCQFIGPFAIERFHINVVEVGYLYANIGISVALGHLFLTPRLANYFSSQASLTASLIALAALLVLVVFSWNMAMLHLATVFVMLACAVAYTNAMALVSNQGGKEQQGEIMGIAVSVQSCAEFLPASIVGLIAALSQNIPILMAALFAAGSYAVLLPLAKKMKLSD